MPVTINGSGGITSNDGSAAAPPIAGTDSNTGIFFPAADTIAFAEGGAEVARFDSSGNLGIGTSSPAAKFAVSNGGAAGFEFSPTGGISSGTYIQSYNRSTSAYVANTNYASTHTWYVASTRAMDIDSSGNLLVGKTTAGENTGGNGTTIFGGSNAEISVIAAASTSAQSGYTLYSSGAGAYRFYVGMQGQIYATNTTISAISDQRFKENIQDLDVGLGAVMALKPRKFDWKEGKGKNIKGDRGFIAQEFEQVFPDMIDEWRDPAPEGEEPYKSVRADLIPVLVKAIQELKAELDTAKARIAALEAA